MGNLIHSVKKVRITQILPFRPPPFVLDFGGGFGGWFYLTNSLLMLIKVIIQIIHQLCDDFNGINGYTAWTMK